MRSDSDEMSKSRHVISRQMVPRVERLPNRLKDSAAIDTGDPLERFLVSPLERVYRTSRKQISILPQHGVLRRALRDHR